MAKEHKADKDLVSTPMEYLCGDPKEFESGEGEYNGVPGLPKRTGSKFGVPEQTLVDVEGYPKGKA